MTAVKPLMVLRVWGWFGFVRCYDCYLPWSFLNILYITTETSTEERCQIKRNRNSLWLILKDRTVNCVPSLIERVFILSFRSLLIRFSRQRLCSSFHLLLSSLLLSSLLFSSRRPPLPLSPSLPPSLPPAVLWDVMMLWQAWRLFLEVPVFMWHSGGGWYRNSAGVVVCGVGVEIWGGLGWFENCEILSHCIDRRETREDCVSWLPGCKFSLSSLTHKFDELCYLSRQRWSI